MSAPVTRDMWVSDLDRVADLEREAFPRPWGPVSLRAELERPPAASTSPAGRADGVPYGFCRVVTAPEGVVAYIIAWFIGEEAHVARIAVAPRARRRGHARLLMHELIVAARTGGIRALVLEVRADNHPALELYTALGFVAVGTRHGYYEEAGVRQDAHLLYLGLEGGAGGDACPPSVGR